MDNHFDKIFVFGSNESGYHGAGAALCAVKCKGAIMYQGFGPAGDSFAIPTKDWKINNLNLTAINNYTKAFIRYANLRPKIKFQVTAIGCGLAGYKNHQIAPMFKHAPENCYFPEEWEKFLTEKNIWGTFQ